MWIIHCRKPQGLTQRGPHPRKLHPAGRQFGQPSGVRRFGQPFAVRSMHQAAMGVAHLGKTEQVPQMALPCRRGPQVTGPHHLIDSLHTIIDDDSQVVGVNPVIATQDDVVHLAQTGATGLVGDLPTGDLGGQPSGSRAHSRAALAI